MLRRVSGVGSGDALGRAPLSSWGLTRPDDATRRLRFRAKPSNSDLPNRGVTLRDLHFAVDPGSGSLFVRAGARVSWPEALYSPTGVTGGFVRIAGGLPSSGPGSRLSRTEGGPALVPTRPELTLDLSPEARSGGRSGEPALADAVTRFPGMHLGDLAPLSLAKSLGTLRLVPLTKGLGDSATRLPLADELAGPVFLLLPVSLLPSARGLGDPLTNLSSAEGLGDSGTPFPPARGLGDSVTPLPLAKGLARPVTLFPPARGLGDPVTPLPPAKGLAPPVTPFPCMPPEALASLFRANVPGDSTTRLPATRLPGRALDDRDPLFFPTAELHEPLTDSPAAAPLEDLFSPRPAR